MQMNGSKEEVMVMVVVVAVAAAGQNGVKIKSAFGCKLEITVVRAEDAYAYASSNHHRVVRSGIA